MKKVLAVVAIVCVMSVAGAAFAQQNGHNGRQPMNRHMQNVSRDFRPGQPGQSARGEIRCPGRERMRKAPMFTPDMPQEIREKAAELAKLRIDLKEAMTSRPLNKEKAIEVHAKMQKLKQEIATWRFTQRLERIEAMQKKGLPPAPEKAPETPANESAE